MDVATLAFLATTDSLMQGAAVTLEAIPYDATGRPLQRAVTYATDAPSVATVDADGILTGRAGGVVTVHAFCEGRTAAMRLRVLEPAAHLIVEVTGRTLRVGERVRLEGRAFDEHGSMLNRTPVWTSDDASVVEITPAGEATARSAGETVARATLEGLHAELPIHVEEGLAALDLDPDVLRLLPGERATVTAVLRDARGMVLAGEVRWSVADPRIARADASGMVMALLPGATTLLATSGSLADTVVVLVLPPVASVRILPDALHMRLGALVRIAAAPRDGTGRTLDRTVTWSSEDDRIVHVDPEGVVTALEPGTTRLRARSETVTGYATVTVYRPATTLDVSPIPTTLVVGQTVPMIARPYAADGSPATGRPVTWMSEDPAVALVSTTGELKALSPGTATIRVASDDARSSFDVRVVVPRIVIVDPRDEPHAPVHIGASLDLDAQVLGLDGIPVELPVTWTSSDPAVATVDAHGLVTGIAHGDVAITARAGSAQAVLSLRVRGQGDGCTGEGGGGGCGGCSGGGGGGNGGGGGGGSGGSGGGGCGGHDPAGTPVAPARP